MAQLFGTPRLIQKLSGTCRRKSRPERSQFYLDLYADDAKLLKFEHLIEKLGNEPAREEQARRRTFSQRLFPSRKPSTFTRTLDFAAQIAYEWTELKFSDSNFEAASSELVSWHSSSFGRLCCVTSIYSRVARFKPSIPWR